MGADTVETEGGSSCVRSMPPSKASSSSGSASGGNSRRAGSALRSKLPKAGAAVGTAGAKPEPAWRSAARFLSVTGADLAGTGGNSPAISDQGAASEPTLSGTSPACAEAELPEDHQGAWPAPVFWRRRRIRSRADNAPSPANAPHMAKGTPGLDWASWRACVNFASDSRLAFASWRRASMFFSIAAARASAAEAAARAALAASSAASSAAELAAAGPAPAGLVAMVGASSCRRGRAAAADVGLSGVTASASAS